MISIIIPIYNSAAVLERCLKSVRVQTYPDIEVLMINDGSADDSESICKRFAEEDKRFKYIYQDNAGVSAARNNGIRNIKGDYYTFLDSDDWVDENYCKYLYDKAIDDNADMVFCYMNRVINGVCYPQEESAFSDIIANKHVERFLIGHPQYVQGACYRVLYKSDKFNSVRYCEDLHVYEDLIYLLSCVKLSEKMSLVDKHLYYYELPATGYFKKYYRENLFDICYTVGKKLNEILSCLGREKWAQAELFKEYCLAVDWVIDTHYDKAKLNELKNHAVCTELCNKANYKTYKKLYTKNFTSKLRIRLLYKKHFGLYKKLLDIRKRKA